MAAIRCQNVSKAFPLGGRAPGQILKQHLLGSKTSFDDTFWALRDVSFEVEKGEAVAIVGRNGSGKSTLLQVLTGVYPPTDGRVEVDGKISALLELGSGFDPEYTGRENIYVNGAVLGLTRAQINDRIDEIVGFADIGGFIDEPVRVYSSGMFVRLAFSVAVHTDPDILIVDEALSVGDARFAAKCMRRIKTLRESGVTLLFVSHDVGSVRALCDRAIWLSEGRVRQAGTVFDVTAKYSEYLFGDEPEDAQEPFDAVGSSASESPNGADEPPMPPPSVEAVATSERSADAELSESGILNHWGSQIGIVGGFQLLGSKRNDRVFEYGESLRAEIQLVIPEGLETEDLSIAFSIKDLRGTDLLVCASALHAPRLLKGVSGRAKVYFEFDNLLVDGKYYVALAVEDRSGPSIHYYEYIEGIYYFASLTHEHRFGIFNVPFSVGLERVDG